VKPEDEADQGVLHVLFVLTLLLHPDQSPLLAVRNLGQGLIPPVARRLAARMQAIVLGEPDRPQLLLSTDAPHVLDAIDLADDRARLFIVARDHHGATQVQRILSPPRLRGRKSKLSDLWISGALGGTPHG
jgi:predicted ATPase